jgi:hypothetical protein
MSAARYMKQLLPILMTEENSEMYSVFKGNLRECYNLKIYFPS